MKLVRFAVADTVRYGILEHDEVIELKGDVFAKYTVTALRHRLSDVRLLSPCEPSKIVALGKNYMPHIQEFDGNIPSEPLMFIKPSSAVVGPGQPIILPTISRKVDYEGELAVVIKDQTRNIDAAQAFQHILGYTCGNDVTARDLQTKDGQWTRSKGFDTFAPLGPCIETNLDPHNLKLEVFLNGKVKQTSSTGDMLFKVPETVCAVARVMTLFPGDVIMTGTPAGVGPMKDGDHVEVRIEGIGSLLNPVRNELIEPIEGRARQA